MRRGRFQGHTDHANTISSIRTHQNLPFLSKKMARNGPFFGHILIFLAFVQAVEGSLPHFEGAGCKKANCMHARTTKAQCTASVCTKICYFSWNNCQKRPFFGQKLSLLASDRQLQRPLPHFEGAGCKRA